MLRATPLDLIEALSNISALEEHGRAGVSKRRLGRGKSAAALSLSLGAAAAPRLDLFVCTSAFPSTGPRNCDLKPVQSTEAPHHQREAGKEEDVATKRPSYRRKHSTAAVLLCKHYPSQKLSGAHQGQAHCRGADNHRLADLQGDSAGGILEQELAERGQVVESSKPYAHGIARPEFDQLGCRANS